MSSKTHKGIKARVKVTKNGKIMYKRAGGRHLLGKKNSKRKRKLRQWSQLGPEERKKLKKMYDFTP